MQLCAKFQKNLMRGSPDIALRTDARTDAWTDARTNERESIGLSANAERPKTLKIVNLAKKWPNFRLKWPKFCQIRILQAYSV